MRRGSPEHSGQSWRVLVENMALWGLAIANAVALFLFLRNGAPFPIGDDPGYHTTLVNELLRHDFKTDFTLPIFPQVETPFPLRAITPFLAAALARTMGITDPFLPSITLAAGALALSSLVLYLLAARVTRSRWAALVAALFFSWAKWGQEAFWEGNYDQLTSLPILLFALYSLWRWTERRQLLWLALTGALLAVLRIAHEFSFLLGLTTVAATVVITYFPSQNRPATLALLGGTVLVLVPFLLHAIPSYFVPMGSSYPLPLLLSAAEGVQPVVAALAAIGVVLSFRQPGLAALILLPLFFSQMGLLELPLYPFRFNLYAMAAIGLALAVAAAALYRAVEVSWGRGLSIGALVLMLAILIPSQYAHVTGLRLDLTREDHPAGTMPLYADIAAFSWLGTHVPTPANVAAPMKWGYYLPAVSGHAVTLDDAVGGDARDNRHIYAKAVRALYETEYAEDAAVTAREIGVTHVFVGKMFVQQPDRYASYRLGKFDDAEYFTKVYDVNDARIYAVR
jgi:hypothetical protein